MLSVGELVDTSLHCLVILGISRILIFCNILALGVEIRFTEMQLKGLCVNMLQRPLSEEPVAFLKVGKDTKPG